jgi:hypothetical protein
MGLRRISPILVAIFVIGSGLIASAAAFTPNASAADRCTMTVYRPYRSDTATVSARFRVNNCTSGIVRASVWARMFRNGTAVSSGLTVTGYPTSDFRFNDLCWNNATYKAWGKLTVYNSANSSASNQGFGNPLDIGCNGGLGPALSALLGRAFDGPTSYPIDDGVGIDYIAEIP